MSTQSLPRGALAVTFFLRSRPTVGELIHPLLPHMRAIPATCTSGVYVHLTLWERSVHRLVSLYLCDPTQTRTHLGIFPSLDW